MNYLFTNGKKGIKRARVLVHNSAGQHKCRCDGSAAVHLMGATLTDGIKTDEYILACRTEDKTIHSTMGVVIGRRLSLSLFSFFSSSSSLTLSLICCI